jgi:hypothetical protein
LRASISSGSISLVPDWLAGWLAGWLTVLSRRVVPCRALSCLVVSGLVLSCLVLSCRVVSCLPPVLSSRYVTYVRLQRSAAAYGGEAL